MKLTVNTLQDAGMAMRMMRKAQGFTQKEFALQLGISHFLARDIEQGKPSVKLGNFVRYAEELGMGFTMEIPVSNTNMPGESGNSRGN